MPALTVLAAAVAAAMLQTAVAAPTTAMSSCAVQMDGKLPSYVPPDFSFTGNVRRYYVATNEVEWDYVPSGWDNERGVPLAQSNTGSQYLASNTSLGTKYIKGLYQGYTDATFKTRTPSPEWIGYQGPVMRGEVGDMIEILVYNNFTSDFVSMHSMGLFYSKTSEGSDYYNVTLPNGKAAFSEAQAIAPGNCFTYKWLIPQSSAPLSSQASKLWSYHGEINLEEDVDTGLVGPFIAYQTGKMNQTMAENREFVLLYAATEEQNNVFYGKTIAKYLPQESAPDPGPSVHPTSHANASIWNPIDVDQPNSAISPKYAQAPTHINGYMYANLPGLLACHGDSIIWYIYSFGVFNDGFHVSHAKGNNYIDVYGENQAVVPMLPGTMYTLGMKAYNPGIWNMICHTADHFEQGMEAQYQVYMPGECPASVSGTMNVMM